MAVFSRTWLLKLLDAGPGYVLCKTMGRWRHHTGATELSEAPAPESIERILVIRPGGMGDMLMLLPVIRSIRDACPNAAVDVICEKRNEAVLRLAGLDVTTLLYDIHPLRTLAAIRRVRYSLVLDTEQFHNFSAIIACLSGAPVRIGFKVNPARLHLYTHLVDYDMYGRETTQFYRLLTSLNIETEPQAVTGFLRGPTAEGAPPLPANFPSRGDRIVAISPGSSNRYKHWNPACFARVIQAIDDKDITFLLVGGWTEANQAQAIMDRSLSATVHDYTGKLDLEQTAAVLSRAMIFIGCDSGVGHLATALGIPTLILFGPSDPRKWSHPGPRHAVVRNDLPCAPCASFGYYKLCRDIPCMQTITAESVVARVKELLHDVDKKEPAAAPGA